MSTMLRVNLNLAKPGMKLALPVNHPRHRRQNLLRVDYEIDEQAIERLLQIGVRGIWVQYPALEFIKRYIDREALKQQEHLVEQITDSIGTAQQSATAKMPFEVYCDSVGSLVDSLVGNAKAAMFLGDLADTDAKIQTKDPPTEKCIEHARNRSLLRHSSTVAYLSVLMGLKLEAYLIRQRPHVEPTRAKDITPLGLGAMLHDIGITRLDDSVREHYEHTGDETDPDWQKHPALGYEMVHGKIEPAAATCVLHHHQRADGSGYCGKNDIVLDGRRIHVFARIVGLADKFDSLRFPPGGDAQPTVAVLKHLQSEAVAEQFDTEVLRALLTVVPPYAPGTLVKLTGGKYAAVIDHNPINPCRPTVQTLPDPAMLGKADAPAGATIDLSEIHSKVEIIEHDDHDVRGLNFDIPKVMLEFMEMKEMKQAG